MKIIRENLLHGAVIQRIVEWKDFTSINSLEVKGKKIPCAYQVNKFGVFCRYSSEIRSSGEYVFNFEASALEAVLSSEQRQKTHIALICVEDLEICLVDAVVLKEMLAQRQELLGKPETTLTVFVRIDRSFKVYASSGVRGKPICVTTIRKNAFPKKLFS